MSALASASLEFAAPERRPDGTPRERRRLWLISRTPEALVGDRLPSYVLDVWDDALDANESALDAVATMKVYADAELLWRRQRLRDERDWLARLRAMGMYAALRTSAKARNRGPAWPGCSLPPRRSQCRQQAHPSVKEREMSITSDEARRIGEQIGIDWETAPFDVEQFRMGMNVELEHGLHDSATNVTGDDPVVTGKIALAHLNEFPDYYTRLDRMEKEAKRDHGMG
jgi:hypothetical protein